MLEDIFLAVWFFLPAAMGNVAPIIAAKLPYMENWTFPLDGYATFRGKRFLGDHKTMRGMVTGILAGIATAFLQVELYINVAWVREIVTLDYSRINPLLLGALAALGALTGDAFKSFFKRQSNIAPGTSWVPFDQVDYVIGGVVFTACYVRLSFFEYLLLFGIWTLVHPIATYIGYALKLKNSPI